MKLIPILLLLCSCATQPRLVVLRTYKMPNVYAEKGVTKTNYTKCFVLGYRSGTNEVEVTTVTK